MGSTTTLQLQPNGLYILVSIARPDYPAPITEDTIEESFAKGDQFEWGLYWCKCPGYGESRRYRERQGIWQLQTTWYPDNDRKSLVPIETDVRIILAIHIANMDKPMVDRLNEDLKPRHFSHSQRAIAQAARSPSSQRRTRLTGATVEPDDGRSRKWLGQALFMMGKQGYISLKEDATSISLIEKEATKQARRNLAAKPTIRTVEPCEHVDIRSSEAVFRLRVLGGCIEIEASAGPSTRVRREQHARRIRGKADKENEGETRG